MTEAERRADIEARQADVDRRVETSLAIVCTIHLATEPIGDRPYSGDVACPVCDGRLHYSFIGRRRQMTGLRVKCSTAGCVGFLS